MEWLAWIKVVAAALFLCYVLVRHRVVARRRLRLASRKQPHRHYLP